MNTDHLAKEAKRLKNDDVLRLALDDIRAEALEELAGASIDDPTTILRLQQKVAVIDDFRTMLGRYILRAGVAEEAGPYA